MNQLLDFLPQHIFALNRRERDIDFLTRNASRIRKQIAQIIRFLELNPALEICHLVLPNSPGEDCVLSCAGGVEGSGEMGIRVAGLGLFTRVRCAGARTL